MRNHNSSLINSIFDQLSSCGGGCHCESKPETKKEETIVSISIPIPPMAHADLANEIDTSSSSPAVAVAIDKDRNSQNALKWALDNIISKEQTVFLIHVNTKGQQDEASNKHAKDLLYSFRCFCTRKDVKCNDIVLEDVEVAKAIVDFASQNYIEKLVLGAPSRSGFLRVLKMTDVASSVSKVAPDFCSVFVINSKGKVSSRRNAIRAAPPALLQLRQLANPTPLIDQPRLSSSHSPSIRSENHGLCGGGGDWTPQFIRRGGVCAGSRTNPPNESSPPDSANASNSFAGSGRMSIDRGTNASFASSGRPSIDRIFNRGGTGKTQQQQPGDPSFPPTFSTAESLDYSFETVTTTSQYSNNSSSLTSPDEVEAEMARLRQELKQTMDMYSNACKEASTAKQKTMELQQWKGQEAQKLERARVAGEAARAMAEKEKAKSRAATEAAQASRRIAELESQKRRYAESKAARDAEEKNRALQSQANNNVLRYRKYSKEDIKSATCDFAEELKIGEGGYGPVYKAFLDHTPVAIKVLRTDGAQGRAQFQQEVEILSSIRHPNMVLLVGACPEIGCLVYENMTNGSLEDCLFHRGTRPPVPWQHRFRIAAEIGTGLLFLHQTKPEPLVHRDLKPANILLDGNYVSKISDVGLARLVPPSVADNVTRYLMTSTAGTFCYIDPEYQQTGMLGIKSDVYSLGIMLLQIITARPPMGLTHHVERAIDKGTFAGILDPAITDWPYQEALALARMALRCSEMRRRDRPDLGTQVLPLLNSLRDLANQDYMQSCTQDFFPQTQLSWQHVSSGPQEEYQSGYESRTASVSSMAPQDD